MTEPTKSYVVTGGGRGVGRAIVERLLDDHTWVGVIELDGEALDWIGGHPRGDRVIPVVGSAGDETVAEGIANEVERLAPLAGWVNNAALFRDAFLHETPSDGIVELVTGNLAPVVAGSSAAVRRFLSHGRPGAIVNVSSHQAQRAVRGAMPYATSKAAIEGFTRALAVDYGQHGIRVNAVALGSVTTERYESFLREQSDTDAQDITHEMARLHPLGRVGSPAEVASAVAYLLSDEAGFITGAVLPVDGGRSAQGLDPEQR